MLLWTESYLQFIARGFVIASMLLLSNVSGGNHFLGGDIEYQCLGGTSYQVTFNMYRDCASTAPILPVDLDFESDCGTSFTVAGILPSPGVEVSQLCPSSLANSTCNGGTLPGTVLLQYTTVVNLANCDSWRISWTDCCRSASANGVATFGMYIEAVLNSATAPCNNSPQFTDGFIPYVCVGQQISYNFGVVESDGDSLSYSLIDARYNAPFPTPIPYNPPYSGASPITGIALDPVTGQVLFTAPVLGNYIVAVLVEEFDAAGNLIGSVMRDMVFVVLPCTGNVPNAGTLLNNSGGTITGGNSIQLCDGEVFCVDVEFTDPDPGDVLTVTASAATMPPGATLTVAGTNPVVATLCWTADIAQSPVNVILTASDGACPLENLALAAINVAIYNSGVAPDPGLDAVVTYCSSDPTADLFPLLGGTPDPTGSWSYPNGTTHSGLLDPSADPGGVYTYTVPGVCGAPDASSTVTVTINQLPDPGISGSVNLCSSSPNVDLFNALAGGPDAGGTWTDPNGSSVSGVLDPAVGPGGVYTYTVTGTGTCPDQSSTVTVALSDPPDPGLDATVTYCQTDPVVSLFTVLGGTPDAGGAWTAPSGGPTTGNFNPAIQATGNYTYTIGGVPPCPGGSSTVTVNVVQPLSAGNDAVINICSSSGTTDLFAQLTGTPDPGGIWTDPNGNVHNGTFDHASDPVGAYQYTHPASAPCAASVATVTVNAAIPPNAGTNATINLCSSDPVTSLFNALGGTPDAGGAWTDPNGNVHTGSFDPSLDPTGIYTYTVFGIAPCPDAMSTVTVSVATSGDAGISVVQSICADTPPFDLFSLLGGSPDPGGQWTDPNNVAFGPPFDPLSDPLGVYVYTVPANAPCLTVSSTVDISVIPIPDAGIDASISVCGTAGTTDLFSVLGGAPDPGGTWTDPNGIPFTQPFDPTTDAAGVYVYSLPGIGACAGAQANVTVTIAAQPDAGTDTFWDLCETYAPLPLITLLGGTPDVGGTWTDPSGAPFGNTLDPAVHASGTYTYTVSGVAPCPSASAQVNVLINSLPDAGSNGTLTVCSNGANAALFPALGGAPNVGGTWTDPNGSVHSGTFDPLVDPSGVFTYTVTGAGSCPDVSSDVDVTVINPPNAGSDASISLCSTGSNFNLFNAVGGSPAVGGTWTDPNGMAVTGVVDPSVAVSGPYTYSIAGNAPCADASAVVTLTVVPAPDTGVNGVLDICSTDGPSDLFLSLGGSPSGGGTWTDPNGDPFSGILDPGVSVSGTYTYTISAPFPCVTSGSDVVVNIYPSVDAGTDASVTLCAVGGVTDLFTQLGGTPDAGGSWSGPGGAFGGNFDPLVDVAGNYTYTVTGTAPCADASAVVTVSLTNVPNAGTAGSVDVCSNGGIVDLFNELGGGPDAGGSWTDPNGNAHSGSYDVLSDPAGVYTYTITGVAPCPSASGTVTVNVVPSVDAGMDASVTLCAVGGVTDLFTQLGGTPDAGGSWIGPGGAFSGNFDPLVDVAGNYTYTVTGTAPCADASAVVTVSLTNVPNAGTAGSVDVCSNGGIVDLFNELGGGPDAGGSWTDPNGNAHSGSYDVLSDPAGVYTYTITGVAPCPSASGTVTVNVVPSVDAGMDASVTLCAVGGVTDLFTQLGGTPDAGGSWIGPGGAFSGNFDPLVDVAGNYTYTVTGTAPCTDATAVVTVAVTSIPDPGLSGSVNVCSTGGSINLFNQLGGGPDAGGSWEDPFGNPHSGMLDPSVDPTGVYIYELAATPPCPGASQTVTVTISSPPNAGSFGVISVCTGDPSFGLVNSLSGTPDPGGTWVDPLGNASSGLCDPSVDPSGLYVYTVNGGVCPDDTASVSVNVLVGPNAGMPNSISLCSSMPPFNLLDSLLGSPDLNGSWQNPAGDPVSGGYDPSIDTTGVFTYTVAGNAACPDDVSTLTITTSQASNAGVNGSINLCSNDPPFDMFTLLGTSAQAGGDWVDPSGGFSTGIVDPAADTSGAYTYTVLGIAPCPDDQATISVTITPIANAGQDTAFAVCSSDAPFNLFDRLGGLPIAGGSWFDQTGFAVSGVFDPSTDQGGTFSYVLAQANACGNDTAVIVLQVIEAPFAGWNSSTELCANAMPFSMLDSLNNAPDTTGVWLSPVGQTMSGLFDPAVNGTGRYTYVVNSAAPCSADSAFLDVLILLTPDPVISFTPLNACSPMQVIFDNLDPVTGSCIWTFGNGDTSYLCTGDTVTYQFAGSFSPSLSVSLPNGCQETVISPVSVDVYDQPSAGFNVLPPQINQTDPSVYLQNTAQGWTDLFWVLGDLGINTEISPVVTFPSILPDEFEVCQVVFAGPVCSDTLCTTIEVAPGLTILVPNSFTPNADGQNDFFMPVVDGVNADSYEFRVFNRWGEELFLTTVPGEGWDGTYKGAPAQLGVYVWQVIAQDSMGGETERRQGHVTLVR